MAENNNKDNNNNKIHQRAIVQDMQDSYLDYAMSVIVARALPDVRDGLKPVHRRILYSMREMGLYSNARFRKSAAVVGNVLMNYHPHGDSAVYDALVRLAQDFSMRYPLVHGQGNFGSLDGDPPAAQRYTEARMMPIARLMLDSIDKDTVDFRDNYDATQQEPTVLPAAVPQLLLNGTVGIAVGMATNIPPHNMGEVIDASVHLLQNPKAEVKDLMQFIQGPDFPTAGNIYNKKAILEAYGQGKGPIVLRGTAEAKSPTKKDNIKTDYIEITEIPYQVNKANFIEKVADLVQQDRLPGVKNIRDESDRHGLRIIIELKRDSQPKKTLNKLYKFTELQKTFHMNMLALVDGIQPRVLNLKEVLEKYLDHKREVVRRRTEYDLARAKERAHVLEGLKKALDDIDNIIATIKKSKDRDNAHKNLRQQYKFTEVQANAILDMRLQNLANLERKKIEDELEEKKKLIEYYEALLKSKVKMRNQIKKELLEAKEQFSDERRTKVYARPVGKFNEEDLIPKEEMIISMTRGGYVKRVSPSAYRKQHRGGKGIVGMETRGDDVVEHFLSASTHDRLLFFTNTGRVFQTLAYEIPSSTRTARGKALVNFLELKKDEFVTTIVPLTRGGEKREEAENKFLVMATKNGIIKKTPLEDFENVRRSGLIALQLKKGDTLSWVGISGGNDEIVQVTKNGQAIRFPEKDVRSMGRTAAGVRSINIKADDEVVGTDIVTKEDQNKEMLLLTSNGYGKRTSLSMFKKQKRGGAGVKAAKITNKTGDIVSIRVIRDAKELIVISTKGQVIRIDLNNISKLGRVTQGVRIMNLKQGDKVASIATV